jgi:hypothetical protein
MILDVKLGEELHPAGCIQRSDEVLASHGEVLSPQEPVRLVYAASHVVMLESYSGIPHSVVDPGSPEEIEDHIDWPATMALRSNLAAKGFAIAEAMDTAQRFRIGWPSARRLIEECGRLSLPTGFVAGAGTDHLAKVAGMAELIDGVLFQANLIQANGGEVILLPMPELPRWNVSSDQYVEVYRSIIDQLDGPVYVHWLGEMFLPELAGYFPGDSFERVMSLDPSKVRGAKISLLDSVREVEIRRALSGSDQVVLTGDDFHFASLIAGEGCAAPGTERVTTIGSRCVPFGDFSHALLGIFDAISSPASLALQRLAQGDVEGYFELMAPAEALSRVVFEPPTTYYKSGLAFLSWLNGAQSNPMLVNHEQTMRASSHYVRIADLASKAGAIRDAGIAAERLQGFLELS